MRDFNQPINADHTPGYLRVLPANNKKTRAERSCHPWHVLQGYYKRIKKIKMLSWFWLLVCCNTVCNTVIMYQVQLPAKINGNDFSLSWKFSFAAGESDLPNHISFHSNLAPYSAKFGDWAGWRGTRRPNPSRATKSQARMGTGKH